MAPTDTHRFNRVGVTGDDMLDLAISNRPNGGFPVGRIVEVTGLEASGKSLLSAHTLANTQKKGGLAVYIDTENAINQEFLEALGVDTQKLLYVPLETVEDIFDAMDSIIESIRKSDKDRLVTIVVDSVAAATTKVELSADYDQWLRNSESNHYLKSDEKDYQSYR